MNKIQAVDFDRKSNFEATVLTDKSWLVKQHHYINPKTSIFLKLRPQYNMSYNLNLMMQSVSKHLTQTRPSYVI